MGQKENPTAKKYEVRISISALQNIDEITGYIAFIELQPDNAAKVGDAIYDTIDRIQLHPLAFRECEELVTKGKIYRRARCLSWSIIYKVAGTDILILGIIHDSRKPIHTKKLRSIKS
ncbi:MAG: type II toxin-antitoxin system RelE/ParE family toxin [Taibaiella sp.]|nr:type II toxin-antitoxin system RelE/ParE family toxin [Taibaiella sp.]